jgi:hypothetical protein
VVVDAIALLLLLLLLLLVLGLWQGWRLGCALPA